MNYVTYSLKTEDDSLCYSKLFILEIPQNDAAMRKILLFSEGENK